MADFVRFMKDISAEFGSLKRLLESRKKLAQQLSEIDESISVIVSLGEPANQAAVVRKKKDYPKPGSKGEQIIRILQNGPLSQKAIEEQLAKKGENPNGTYAVLAAFSCFAKAGKGLWAYSGPALVAADSKPQSPTNKPPVQSENKTPETQGQPEKKNTPKLPTPKVDAKKP